MKYGIKYHAAVVREDILKLGSEMKLRVKEAIEKKLVVKPEVFGKPLRKSLKGYRVLRVGNYRVVFRIEADVVKVFAIVHREIVYDKVLGRFK